MHQQQRSAHDAALRMRTPEAVAQRVLRQLRKVAPMNPWDLDSTGLMIWGLVAHLVADWPLQNDWMANNKATSLKANAVHSGIHTVLLAVVFGWPAILLGIVHGLIDTRTPVVWWSQLVRQTQPGSVPPTVDMGDTGWPIRNAYDVGLEVRFWTDQVFHVVCVAIAALIVGSL